MTEELKIVYIDIEEFGIDKCNIRQGIWDADVEIVNSVKEGIRQPLLVRPVPPEAGKKYGIVCGSRRYNAALEAGLDKVPCIIQDMTDIEAMEESMREHIREDPPLWMEVEHIRKMYDEHLKNGLSRPNAVEAMAKTGKQKSFIKKCIEVSDLPEEVKGLLREPGERTERQKESLMLYQTRKTRSILTLSQAYSLTKFKDFPLEKQMEVAAFILNKSPDTAEKIVDAVKRNPDKSVDQLYNELIGESDTWSRTLHFSRKICDAIGEACMAKQKFFEELISEIIKDWLKRHGFLKPKRATEVGEIDFDSDEEYIEIETNEKNLRTKGYRYLKEEAGIKIYQKEVGKGSGFFKVYFRRNVVRLTVTLGSYSNPDNLLKAEKEKLEI